MNHPQQYMPEKPEYAAMKKKLSDAGKKAVQEMLNRPFTIEEACANLDRLRNERLTREDYR